MIRALSVFCALLIGTAPLASAEDIDLSGNWSVATNMNSCTLTGKATLAPATDGTLNSDYACELTMRQACPNGYEVVVRQSCRVRNIRGQITVQSSIEEFIVGNSAGYAPDNFRLSAQSSTELYGAQIDRYGTLSATWTRATGSIS